LEPIVKIFQSTDELAREFAGELINMIIESAGKKQNFNIALSGGSTPEIIFTQISENFKKSVSWQNVHFFWGDERCVQPDDAESNFGMAWRKLLGNIEIPTINIHRIKGEDDPETEAVRYSEEILTYTRKRNGIPVFDLVLLGLGEDGHTASIFPGHIDLFKSDKICKVAVHPVTFQKRITLTGRVINNADSVTFLVTGKNKGVIVEKIFKKNLPSINYPASYVVPVYGRLYWFLDKEAGRLL
jgi:6-phosphogluconolactonase